MAPYCATGGQLRTAPLPEDAPEGLGHQDLPAGSRRADPRRRVHRLARELIALPRDLACVQADAHAQRHPHAIQIERVERTLNADRARQRAAGRHEHREEAVAERRLLILAFVLLDLLPDELVVLAKEPVGVCVTERRPQRGRTFNVGEQEGHRTLGQIR